MRILTAIVLRHPFLLRDVSDAFARLPMPPDLARLREAMEAWADAAEALDSIGLINHLTDSGFHLSVEQVLAGVPMPLPACASSEAMPAEAEAGWWEFFGYLNVEHLQEEVVAAEAEAARNLTTETQRRLLALRQALNRIRIGEAEGIEPFDAKA